jgi:hypothetical protein
MFALDFSEILGLVKTKSASYEFLNVLDSLAEKTFAQKSSNIPNTEVAAKIAHFLNSKNTFADKNFERDLIEKLQKILKNAEVLTIRCAITPSDSFIFELYAWFQSFGLKNFLLDFEMADNIYGGLHLIWKGKVLDLSLKSKISEYVQNLAHTTSKEVSK